MHWKRHLIGIFLVSALLFFPTFSYLQKRSASESWPRWRGYGRISNLKQIMIAIIVYSDEDFEDGTMPDYLWQLYPDYISDPSMLASPADLEPAPVSGRNGLQINRLYYLFEGCGTSLHDLSPGTPVVYYPFLRHDGIAYAVVFADGHARIFSENEFMDIFLKLNQTRTEDSL